MCVPWLHGPASFCWLVQMRCRWCPRAFVKHAHYCAHADTRCMRLTHVVFPFCACSIYLPSYGASTQTLVAANTIPLSNSKANHKISDSSWAQRQAVADSSVQILWSEALRVAGEHGGLANVVQSEVQHDDTLHADTSPAMGRRTQLEGIYIRTDSLRFDVVHLGSLLQKRWKVYSLGPRDDLLQRQPTLAPLSRVCQTSHTRTIHTAIRRAKLAVHRMPHVPHCAEAPTCDPEIAPCRFKRHKESSKHDVPRNAGGE